MKADVVGIYKYILMDTLIKCKQTLNIEFDLKVLRPL